MYISKLLSRSTLLDSFSPTLNLKIVILQSTQLEESEEELQEVMRKYKSCVSQLSVDQITIQVIINYKILLLTKITNQCSQLIK